MDNTGTFKIDETGTFVPYDQLTSRTDLLQTTGWLVRETKDPEFFEARFTLEKFPLVKACVSWSRRVFSSFRRS